MSVTLYGWVNTKREIGGIIFLELITNLDLTPITVVAKKKENYEAGKRAKEVRTGSAIKVIGHLKEKAISKKGREIHPEKIEILSQPLGKLPVDFSGKTDVLLDTRIQYRYLLLRLPKERALFKIRAYLISATRKFFEERGFLEVHTPKICGAGAEGGATVFTLDYFGNKAFLAQSPQLYKQMLVAGVPKVFEITPYFRAEKFSTTRHLNESWGIDAEIAFIDNMEDVMKVLEELIKYTIEYIKSKCKEELKVLGISLKTPELPFKRLTYDEVIDLLNKHGVNLEWGQDLGALEEAKLGEIMEKQGHEFYFIVRYPWEAKPFYIMRSGKLSESFDLDCKGLELASGGQREHRYEELIKNMKDKGLNPEDFKFYLEAFKHGMPPHGGFGLGVERLLMKLLNRNNIREVILFPRDRFRLVP